MTTENKEEISMIALTKLRDFEEEGRFKAIRSRLGLGKSSSCSFHLQYLFLACMDPCEL